MAGEVEVVLLGAFLQSDWNSTRRPPRSTLALNEAREAQDRWLLEAWRHDLDSDRQTFGGQARRSARGGKADERDEERGCNPVDIVFEPFAVDLVGKVLFQRKG